MKQVKRRQFLKNTSTVLSAACGLQFLNLKPAFAQVASAQKRVFVVFLRGGFDGLMLLPPALDSDFQRLANLRGSHTEAKRDSGGQVVKDASGNIVMENIYSAKKYALLAGTPFRVLKQHGWKELLEQDAAIFPHTGSHNSTRSHFEQMDFVEGGSSQRILKMGYLSRLTDVLGTVSPDQQIRSISVGPNVPDSMRGGADPLLVNNLKSLQDALRIGNTTYGNAQSGVIGLKERLRFLSSQEDVADCKENWTSCHKAHSAIESLNLANQTTFDTSSTDLFSVAADVSLSQLKPRLITIDVGGWDIHDDAVDRMLPEGGLLENLASGLKTLKNKLVAANQWNNSVVVVMSEFGRTLAANGNNGVDHGRGGLMMVLGGRIQQPTSQQITKAWDFTKTDGIDSSMALKVLNDYRSVLANIFAGHLNIPSSQVIKTHLAISELAASNGVFPVIGSELTYRNLGMFKA
jgi:uncharacterized protein (DUF1501 family)